MQYLDFDFSDDGHGIGTWDAMASALPSQLPALLAEINTVLDWAHTQFPEACIPLEEGGVWQYNLQAVQEVSTPLTLEFDPAESQVVIAAGTPALPRTTITLTMSGTADFCDALRETFLID